MKLLIAVDGSVTSLQAVRHVLALSLAGLHTEAVLVNVQPPANLYEVVTAHDPELLRDVRSAAGADLVAPAEALLAGAGIGYELEVVGGEAAAMIVELAENYRCDAIVLGAGQDVALGVVASSPVPVTVVPDPPDAGH